MSSPTSLTLFPADLAIEQAKSLVPLHEIPSFSNSNAKDIDWIQIRNGTVGGSIPLDEGRARRARELHRYLHYEVLSDWKSPVNIDGVYRVTYHDTYDDIQNLLVYSKHKDHRGLSLMPDMYQTMRYSGEGVDPIPEFLPYSVKRPIISFRGSSTGSEVIANNERIQTCIWSVLPGNAVSALCDFKLTGIVQVTAKDVLDYTVCTYGSDKGHEIYESIQYPYTHIQTQLQNKFILSIDGNTAAWDRPIWVMRSRSLLFKKESDQICWYYPAFKAGEHYVNVTTEGNNKGKLHNIDNLVSYYHANPTLCTSISARAQNIVKRYCSPVSHIEYTRELFMESAEKNKW
jgi:hypothetical protein